MKQRQFPPLWIVLAGLVCGLLNTAATASGPPPPEDPSETGYFDGRLWRLGLRPSNRSTLALDDAGRLYVTGLDLGTTAYVFPEMARWDGRRWEVLVTNAGPIEILVPLAGQMFAGGGFFQINGLNAIGVARFDGATWHRLGDGVGTRPGAVRAMAGHGNSLYVGGFFTNAGPLAVTNIARWDLATETWNPMADGLPEPVSAVTASEAGVFAGSGSRVLRWTGSNWETLGTLGARGVTPPQVLGLRWHEDALYVAGTFGSVDGQEARLVARWRTGQWEPITTEPIQGTATAVDFVEGRLFVAGGMYFPERSALASASVVSLDGDTWKIELVQRGRNPGTALKSRGWEIFVLDLPALQAARDGDSPVIWHGDGVAWSPISGGLYPVPTGKSVARTPEGVALIGLVADAAGPYPMEHDGWAFRSTTGTTNSALGTLLIPRRFPRIGETACVPATWSNEPGRTVLARLEGNIWKPVTPNAPLEQITHVADSGNRIAIAGQGASATSEVWTWERRRTEYAWEKIGEFSSPGAGIPAQAGSERIRSLEWHLDRLAVGCEAARIGGVLHSNLVFWDGTSWSSPAAIPYPARILKSSGDRLYLGLHSGINSSVWIWNGAEAESLGIVPLGSLEDLSVSRDGLLAVVGAPRPPGTVPLWFRRGDRWEPPHGWVSPDPNLLSGCVWMGNDLHLAGIRPTMSDVESIGLAIWHEPGVRIIARPDGSQRLALRATGAVPARFVWERSPNLSAWVPFATNALGNPGWITDDAGSSGPVFYRVRPVQ